MELKSGFSVGVAHSLRLSVTSAEYFCRRHGSPGGGSLLFTFLVTIMQALGKLSEKKQP